MALTPSVGGPRRLGASPVVAWWTSRAQGDLRHLGMGTPLPPGVPGGLVLRRLHQVHGDGVVMVDDRATHTDPIHRFPEGDALVDRGARHVLAVLIADCAAVALAADDGSHAAVHAGWRGLVAGVVEKAASAVQQVAGGAVVAGLGPCIGPCCYEFDGRTLDLLVDRYGSAVRGTTTWGAPALDLPEAVRRALESAGVSLVLDDARCTGCGADAWSYRRGAEQARQALLVWRAHGP